MTSEPVSDFSSILQRLKRVPIDSLTSWRSVLINKPTNATALCERNQKKNVSAAVIASTWCRRKAWNVEGQNVAFTAMEFLSNNGKFGK